MKKAILKRLLNLLATLIFVIISAAALAQAPKKYNAIYSGVPWFDDGGKVVSAHGANLVKENGRYYLFGEAHTDTSNAFAGFNCYSSPDLYNWTFESIALPVQPGGRLGPNTVGERPKVMKCPATGEYMMYMHTDTLGYKTPGVGYATASNITGPYTFRGLLLFGSTPIKKWDMGTFQDADGAGYVLLHGGDIYQLSNDYKSISRQVNKAMTSGFESPALFRKDSLYYFLGSNLTSWEKNDNYYYTATALQGPWTARGVFAPQGTLTWNSQTTFVLPIAGAKDTTYLFMGDRWAFPKQASAATYVWQPLTIAGTALSIPAYQEAWQINTATGTASAVALGKKTIAASDKQFITYTGNWQQETSGSATISRSAEKGASFSVAFKGKQIGWYAHVGPDGGYAHVVLRNSKGQTMLSSTVDMYCKYPVTTPAFISPILPKGNYTLTVSVTGERGNWSDKKKADYGSTGYFVSLDKLVINE